MIRGWVRFGHFAEVFFPGKVFFLGGFFLGVFISGLVYFWSLFLDWFISEVYFWEVVYSGRVILYFWGLFLGGFISGGLWLDPRLQRHPSAGIWVKPHATTNAWSRPSRGRSKCQIPFPALLENKLILLRSILLDDLDSLSSGYQIRSSPTLTTLIPRTLFPVGLRVFQKFFLQLGRSFSVPPQHCANKTWKT